MAFASIAVLSVVAHAHLGEDASSESQDPNWLEGKEAVEAQDWNRAITALSKAAAAEPFNADIHNWLGYAMRKHGDVYAALASYKRALMLNPSHRSAHEYIGEAYLMAGDLLQAEEHLSILQKLCSPTPCEQLKDLARAITDYKSRTR